MLCAADYYLTLCRRPGMVDIEMPTDYPSVCLSHFVFAL